MSKGPFVTDVFVSTGGPVSVQKRPEPGNNHGWIPVTERLPEEGVSVLVIETRSGRILDMLRYLPLPENEMKAAGLHSGIWIPLGVPVEKTSHWRPL